MQVAIVGAGVMAEAMIAGLLADKAVAPSRLVASHPRRDRDLLASRHGIAVVTRNAEAVPGADIVVLAVKPQMLRSVMREVGPALEKGQVVLSIGRRHAAHADHRARPRGRGARHAEHAVPDPARHHRLDRLIDLHRQAARPGPIGPARHRLREGGRRRDVRGHGHRAIGDGPTYLFAVMEALIDAGVHMGFPRELAHDLVVET